MSTVGFVGLGNMGGPMAANLAAAGHEVKVFDLVPALIAGVEGGTAQASALDAATDVDVFISMLPAGKHVAGLYLEEGVLARLPKGALAIDCSTIDPETAQRVAAAAADKGIAMLDAPVSGGTAGAQNGTLTFIVGGEADALERGRPLFEVMGANVFHAGANGAGQIAKICNNMLLAVQMAGTAEALSLGVDNGLDPKVLSEIMKQSSGGNWALNVYNPFPGVMDGVPASRGYQGGFLVDLMTKDLALAMTTAEQSRSSVPMGSLTKNLYRVHEQTHSAGRLDFSSIQWLYRPELVGGEGS
ncbi:MAG: 3-hydroxyisobutyrate dehydrogenase [Gammaproteobacteria bacterium]|nr:3-hydroxyisobutyrate dehydrogenase [Gammaproteobacteria bacterium]MYK81290.1 3-hydroxyisobutyrate dehydrogenase [Gammaproteobacteria bacterium]